MYKNIAAYNIIRNSYRLSGPARKNLLRSDSDPYYEAFLPDPGFKLDMKMQKLETSYPDTNFILYKIFVGGFDYTNKDDTATMRYLGRPTLQNFLVGLNYKNGEIKYISGQFFTSVIAEDFKIDVKKPSSLIPYLLLRTFSVGGQNIHYKRKRHKQLEFEGYSSIYQHPIVVFVDKKDVDRTQTIITIKAK